MEKTQKEKVTKFTDVLGRPIKIGDFVSFAYGYGRSGYGITTGYVIRETPKKLYIGKSLTDTGTQKEPNKVLVIDSQYQANKLDYPELYI